MLHVFLPVRLCKDRSDDEASFVAHTSNRPLGGPLDSHSNARRTLARKQIGHLVGVTIHGQNKSHGENLCLRGGEPHSEKPLLIAHLLL